MDERHVAILIEARRRALETDPDLCGRRLRDVPLFASLLGPVQRRWFWLALFNFCTTIFNILWVSWQIGFWQFNAVVGSLGAFAWFISERHYLRMKRKLNMPAAEAIARMSLDML